MKEMKIFFTHCRTRGEEYETRNRAMEAMMSDIAYTHTHTYIYIYIYIIYTTFLFHFPSDASHCAEGGKWNDISTPALACMNKTNSEIPLSPLSTIAASNPILTDTDTPYLIALWFFFFDRMIFLFYFTASVHFCWN